MKSENDFNDCTSQKRVASDEKLHVTDFTQTGIVPVISVQPQAPLDINTETVLDDSGITMNFDATENEPSAKPQTCMANPSTDVSKANAKAEQDYFIPNQCVSEDQLSQRQAELKWKLQIALENYRKITENPNYNFPWSPDNYQDTWPSQMMQYQSSLIYWEDTFKARNWFRYNFNPDAPELSTYTCPICTFMVDKSHLRKIALSELATNPNGIMKNSPKLNRQLIERHEESFGHQRMLQDYQALFLEESGPDLITKLQAVMELKENPMNKKTSLVLAAVFELVIHNIPLCKHGAIMNIVEQFGKTCDPTFTVGYGHCKSRRAPNRFLFSISDTFMKKMVSSLNELQMPISVSLDGSSDVSNM